jgi:regulator of protease activity HflC (stomatin/prohibitin superfamily)
MSDTSIPEEEDAIASKPVMKEVVPNGMTDIMKFWFTLALAIFVPLFIGIWIYMGAALLGHRNLLILLLPSLALMLWTLIGGFNRNGEFEHSIGGIFSQVTRWVIPSGVSWWIPRPIGTSLRKTSTEKRTLDRRVSEGKAFVDVKTRDGGQVEIGAVKTWGVDDVRKAGRFTPANLETQVNSLFDRSTRYFALYFDSDEDIDKHPDTALSGKKIEFSRYLMGAKDIMSLGRPAYTDAAGVNHPAEPSRPIPNNTAEKAEALGIIIYNVDVTDVNEPKIVQDARNKAAAQDAEGEGERKDIGSVRKRVLELMWGTSDPDEIAELRRKRGKPLISETEALRTVRAARGDLEDVNIGGDAGDFTKGTVGAAKLKDTKPKGGKTT